jgi:hypothetical protein
MKNRIAKHLKPPFKLSAESVRLAGREVSIKIPFETKIRDIKGKRKTVRGTETTNREDLQADAEALRGRLGQSNRARKDLDFMMNFKKAYPNYQYIGVGHSLGGAILDLFLQAHLISRAISYNPLVQPQDLGGNPLHHRIYHEGDFLYKLFGYKIPGIEVRKTKNSMWSMLFNQTIPFYDSLKNHQLDTFIGGAY